MARRRREEAARRRNTERVAKRKRERWGMSKYLKYKPEFQDSFFNDVPIPDPDRKVQAARRQLNIEEAARAGLGPDEIDMEPVYLEDSTFADGMAWLANQMPSLIGDADRLANPKNPTGPEPTDIEAAAKVVRAFQKTQKENLDFVEMPETALTWFRDVVSRLAYRRFNGTVPFLILERLAENEEMGHAAIGRIEAGTWVPFADTGEVEETGTTPEPVQSSVDRPTDGDTVQGVNDG